MRYLLLVVLTACGNCGPTPPPNPPNPPPPAKDAAAAPGDALPPGSTIDCTKLDQTALSTLEQKLLGEAQAGTDPTADATAAGAQMGGCAFVLAVQTYLGGSGAPPSGSAWNARKAFDQFRITVANGATFHTSQGNL